MFISERIQWKRRTDLENEVLECLWIEVFQKCSKSFVVGSIYRPPEGSKYLPKDFEKHFENLINNITLCSKEIILLRDLNIDYLKKDANRSIKSLMQVNGFSQIINKPTRITESTSTLIDLIYTTNMKVVKKVDVILSSISDHDMVGMVRKFNHFKHPMRTIKCRNYQTNCHNKLIIDISGIE